MYVPLWCKSHFSFLEGASHPEELVEQAKRLGLDTLAITDRDGLYGIVRAHVAAREHGMRIICGAQVTLMDESHILLLAQNRGGYGNLCRLLTAGRRRSPKGESRVSWTEVCKHAEGMIALWGGNQSLLAARAEPVSVSRMLQNAFGDRLYGMIARHRCASEQQSENRTDKRIKRYGLPAIAAPEVLYHSRSRRPLQDVLTCIKEKATLMTAGRRINQNAEYEMLSPDAFSSLYSDCPQLIARTVEIANRCTFTLDELRYRYPTESLPDGTSEAEWLRHLVMIGASRRYHSMIPPDVSKQIETELVLIEELDYGGYFLTMWEIVEYCRAHEILCQGRGSAANSMVCYCLGITAIDPVRMGLLFERFISRERAEPPDIDLDIAHERREEVIQHVYQKYGRDRAAMVANFVRYRPRSAVRDVGKVLGLPLTTLDRLAKHLPHHGEVTAKSLADAGLDPGQHVYTLLLTLTNEILNFPRHLSIHPGGFLLGHDPVCELVPIENATMENRTVIQWDKEDIEALNLFKVDLLGLGALTQLDLCFNLLQERYGVELSLGTVPPNDSETYDMLCRGDTVGVFQVESRAQMAMLPRLKPRSFYDIVVEISLVRPGPISGGMVHPYLRRRRGEEPIDYPHPCLVPVLEKTLGVPLFQEQVMKLAIVAADYTPGEADQLRRDMAAWRRRGRIERHRDLLTSRMVAKGIAPVFAERVFDQIRGFGEYGFPESHAASFALICYATSYLKCHYPAEFACTLLNAQPMGFYLPSTIVHDAIRHSVTVLPIDVSRSTWQCRIELHKGNPAVRMGFRYVKGLGKAERTRMASLEVTGLSLFPETLRDFVTQSQLQEDKLLSLAESGAFDCFGVNRRQALWIVREAAKGDSLPMKSVEENPDFPVLNSSEHIAWDYRRSFHSTRGHPVEIVRTLLNKRGLPDARTIRTYPDKTPVKYAGLVICRQRPATAKGVVFMTLEDETGFVNIVIWATRFEQQAIIAKTSPFLGITGSIQSHEGVVHIVADQLWKPDFRLFRETPRSHDFH